MSIYAIIETRGEQLRVEPGTFYNIRHLALLKPKILGSNNKILIYRVLMIHHKFVISVGHPWLKDAIVKERMLHSHLENKIIIVPLAWLTIYTCEES